MSERPSRCSSCKGRSGEKRWCVTVPERRGRGAARAWTWPPVVHGQFRRKRSRQTPVGATLGHLHMPDRRPHLPGRGPAAGHCQPAGHRPAWGPERQALPTMTPARVIPFTSLRKSPLSGVCQKPGSGVIASEEGDILNGGEGKCPPPKKPRTKWCELFLLQEKKRRLTEEDWLPVTRPVPRSPIALLVSVRLGTLQHPGGQTAATASQFRPRGDSETAVLLKAP